MAEITFTLPGAIPYSNVVVKATPEELGVDLSDAYGVGVAATVFLNLFTQGIEAGKKIDVSPPKGETEETSTALYEKNIAEQSMEETKAILKAGLGSTTEVPWKKVVKADPKPWEEPSATDSTVDDDDF